MKINLTEIRKIARDTTKKSTPAKNELYLQSGMYPFMKEHGTYLEELDAYQTANIMDCVNEWRTLHIKKINIDKSLEKYTPYRYSPRDIVMVNLGSTNIGYEASYYHPAIIINEGYNWVLIAPCSTGRFGKGYAEIVDAYVSSDGVKFDTGIQVDKIRVVDKWRIRNKVGRLSSLRFNELTNRIITLHLNYYEKTFNNLKNDNLKLEKELALKKIELEQIELELKSFKELGLSTQKSL